MAVYQTVSININMLFVATRAILIPSRSFKPLVEGVVDHSLKQSWKLKNISNVQTEYTQIFTTKGGEGTLTLVISLIVDKGTCLLLFIEPFSLCISNITVT